jgi:very-short-patch-repair endonuclease
MNINNKKELLEYRRYLRNHMTDEELILWSKLKNSQLNGFKFRRQHSIGNYILDFYCPIKHLGIEIDGGQHYETEKIKYDENRTNYLISLNIRIIRFTNIEIKKNINGVLNKILLILNDTTTP